MLAGEARALWGSDDGLEVTPLTHHRATGVTWSVDRVRVGERSAVVKVLGRRAEEVPARRRSPEDPTHFDYWRREALVYAHQLPDAYAGSGVSAPTLLARHERGDGSIALWLEDLGSDVSPWTVEGVAAAARALGRAQGRIAVEGGPDQPWLSRRFLRRSASSKPIGDALVEDEDRWGHPLIDGHAPPGLREGMRRLRREAGWFFDLSERLPRTFCHLAVRPANLVRRPDGSVAMVDWSFAGDGALGEDVGNLIVDSVFDHFVPADDLAELDRRTTTAYLDGLGDAGWTGNEQLVRLGVWSTAVEYQWLMSVPLPRPDQPAVAHGGGAVIDPERRLADRLGGLALLVDWAERARSLHRILRW